MSFETAILCAIPSNMLRV